jgi:hypothetical protein
MTLAAHAIVGASIASLMPSHPVLGFVAGFTSHFLLDAIPHWDYSLRSKKEDKNNPMNNDIVLGRNFIFDLFKMSADAFFGLIVALFLFGSLSNFHLIWASFWGAIGAMFPDALQFVSIKWRHEPMIGLRRFHLWVHSKVDLGNRPVLGISTQIITIIFFVVVCGIL